MTGRDENRPGLAAREAAVKLLSAVVDRHVSLDGMIDQHNGNPAYLALPPRDRDLVRAILVTALRFRRTIEAIITGRLDRPLPENARSLSHILHVACAQILFLDIPDHSAVDLAVTHATTQPRTQRFAGLVNAVLRKISRTKDTMLPRTLASVHDCPDWFFDRLTESYGAAKAILITGTHRHEAPIDITVKSDPDQWAEKLGGSVMPTGSIRLHNPEGAVTEMPGFAEGEWWVQDAAASLPARLLGSITSKRVADLCAAPGGKTAQLVLAGADVTAIDISANRIKRLEQNLARLQMKANTLVCDLAKYEPTHLFDAVLLDAPCSSTGTVRRHPDVPWVKDIDDVRRLAEVQRKLLAHAIRVTVPGGIIVFSNCSLDPLEGEDLLSQVLAETGNIELDPICPGTIPGTEGMITEAGTLRTTPADWPNDVPKMAGMDGFFAARLRKKQI